MAPESVSSVITLDLKWNNSRLECLVERYDLNDNFLYVSWNAIECPENYVPISNNVAYLWVPLGSELRRYRARVDSANDGFEWVDHASDRLGAMLILILPSSYIFVYPDDNVPVQSPFKFKSTEDNRIALYWWFPPGRFQIIWHMKSFPNANIDNQCQLLNEEARRRQPPSPPHIDGRPTSSPSSQPQVINEPPGWHVAIQVNDQAMLFMGNQEHIDLSNQNVLMGGQNIISGGQQGVVGDAAEINELVQNTGETISMNARYEPKAWERLLGFAIAILWIGVVAFLIIRNEPIADPNFAIFIRIILSFMAGILGAVIPGFLKISMRGPGFVIRAGGALALFVISFFFTPTVIS